MIVSGAEVSVHINHHCLLSLIVVKELFNDQYGKYSPPLLQLAVRTQVQCIVLDYPELVMYTAHLVGEEEFFGAYRRVLDVGRARQAFSRR